MTKLFTGVVDVLLGKRELRDVLSFILGGITLTIGMMIVINAQVIHHNIAGVLIALAGVANIVTAAIPLKKVRFIDMISFVVVIYGFIKTQSVVAMSVGFYSMLITVLALGMWINLCDWLKKRGE